MGPFMFFCSTCRQHHRSDQQCDYDGLCKTSYERQLQIVDLDAEITNLRQQLADQPAERVCRWTFHVYEQSWKRSCDGRKTALQPASYNLGGDLEYDTCCPGCGGRIEVES